jgi:hypothetical protein
MPKPPPPFRPLAVSIVVERLRIVLPIAAVALVVVALSPGLALLLMPRPPPSLAPAMQPEEEYTSGAHLSTFAALAYGALPAPDPRQRTPPCAEDVGEEEFSGACWLRLDIQPPCPAGKTWERNRKCYTRALRVEKLPREPTSGEHRTLGVANP